jgi:hypothetical protein
VPAGKLDPAQRAIGHGDVDRCRSDPATSPRVVVELWPRSNSTRYWRSLGDWAAADITDAIVTAVVKKVKRGLGGHDPSPSGSSRPAIERHVFGMDLGGDPGTSWPPDHPNKLRDEVCAALVANF